jgi:hypothetical protein
MKLPPHVVLTGARPHRLDHALHRARQDCTRSLGALTLKSSAFCARASLLTDVRSLAISSLIRSEEVRRVWRAGERSRSRISRWRGESVGGLREQKTEGRREVAEGWPWRPDGMINASPKGRLGLVGFEEPVGEPVGDLGLLGELSRRPFESRPTRVEVLRVQALPAGRREASL